MILVLCSFISGFDLWARLISSDIQSTPGLLPTIPLPGRDICPFRREADFYRVRNGNFTERGQVARVRNSNAKVLFVKITQLDTGFIRTMKEEPQQTAFRLECTCRSARLPRAYESIGEPQPHVIELDSHLRRVAIEYLIVGRTSYEAKGLLGAD